MVNEVDQLRLSQTHGASYGQTVGWTVGGVELGGEARGEVYSTSNGCSMERGNIASSNESANGHTRMSVGTACSLAGFV